MSKTDFSNLSRPIQPMPGFIKQELVANDLLDAYKSRPPYQQNDYLAWITRAKRPETQERRLQQMIRELIRGDTYMKMPYNQSGRDRK